MNSFLKMLSLLLLPFYGLAQDGFVINGKVSGILNGTVEAKLLPSEGEPEVPFEKVRIENGAFIYTGKVKGPSMAKLRISTKTFNVLLENTNYTVTGDFNSLETGSFKGSKLNDQFAKYSAYYKPENVMDFILKNPDYEVSAYLAIKYCNQSLNQVSKVYDLLTPNVKESSLGKRLLSIINDYKSKGAGTVFPALKLSSPDGKPFSVEDYAGKIVVIDFWASWCAPCIAYFPQWKDIIINTKTKASFF